MLFVFFFSVLKQVVCFCSVLKRSSLQLEISPPGAYRVYSQKKDIDEIVEYMIIQIFCQQTMKLQFSLKILHNLYHSYGYYYQLFQYVTESKGHYGNTYSKKLHYVVYKYKYYSIPCLVKERSQLWKLFEGYDLPWCTKQPAEQSFNNKCSIIIL